MRAHNAAIRQSRILVRGVGAVLPTADHRVDVVPDRRGGRVVAWRRADSVLLLVQAVGFRVWVQAVGEGGAAAAGALGPDGGGQGAA